MPILDHLEPQAVFSYFEQLCAIPHGSGNTKEISDFLVRFAAAHHLSCIQDAHNNIVIFSPGTPGYESAAPVILQGHMDMVCETAPDCTKDMACEGLDLFVDGDTIGARGTTLGGDDGIAVAMALAILDADDIPHPPLEVVITVVVGEPVYPDASLPPRSARRALHQKVYTFMCDTVAQRHSYAHIEYLPAQDTQPAAQ